MEGTTEGNGDGGALDLGVFDVPEVDDYLKRKAAWENSRKHSLKTKPAPPQRPDDEAL